MKYTEVTLRITPLEPFRDLFMYTLGEEGPYDSFVETHDGLKAYVPTHLYDEAFLKQQIKEADCAVSFTAEEMPDKDWNSEWERTHTPVLVEDKCWIRAPFHPHRSDVQYEIEIEPKMSFGTAHHATTYMMLSLICEVPMLHKQVLDMGCGTAVLAILAAKRDAAHVDAVDVDEWAFRNAEENVQRNACTERVSCRIGDASLLGNDLYDVVFANINRNILMADMARYAAAMRSGALLLLSGFYESDVEALRQEALRNGLRLERVMKRDDWAAMLLVKENN